MKNILKKIFKTKIGRPLPSIFSIETNVSCNLRCPECALGRNLITRDKGLMTLEKFKIVADKIKPFCHYLYIMIWGEPLLNKDIISMIEYASQFTQTCISTNAMLINEAIAERIIMSGLTDLIISVDAASPETYNKYRIGGNFNKVLYSLQTLVDFNKKYGNKVNISPQFIVFKHNAHEMEQFNAMCSSMGLKPAFKAPYIRKGSIFEKSDILLYTRKNYKNESDVRKAMRNCQDVRKVLTILLDGSVVACCYDHNGITTFGNIFEKDVVEIWSQPDYVKFRRNVMKGRAADFCVDNCLEYSLDHERSINSDR